MRKTQVLIQLDPLLYSTWNIFCCQQNLTSLVNLHKLFPSAEQNGNQN